MSFVVSADDLRPPWSAQPGGLGLLLEHHPRAGERTGSGAAGRRSALARLAACGRRLSPPCGDDHGEALGERRCLTMPGVSVTVAEQIAALRSVAGDKVVRLIRREPDETVQGIIANWSRRFDAQKATTLGFRAESGFEEIIRVYVEDELGS